LREFDKRYYENCANEKSIIAFRSEQRISGQGKSNMLLARRFVHDEKKKSPAQKTRNQF